MHYVETVHIILQFMYNYIYIVPYYARCVIININQIIHLNKQGKYLLYSCKYVCVSVSSIIILLLDIVLLCGYLLKN